MKFCFWGNISKGFEGKPMGGGEKQQYLIALNLAKLGHQVVIIDFIIEKDCIKEGVNILSLKQEKKNTKNGTYKSFSSLLKKCEADIYYARIRSSIHLIALYVAKSMNKKFVYHSAHDLDASYFVDRWKGFYLQSSSILKGILHIVHSEILFPFVLKYSDLIICQNEFQYNMYLKKKHAKCKLLIINNLFVFNESVTNIRKEKDIDFIIVSSLDLRKGIVNLLKIIKKFSNFSFVVIGKPRDVNGVNFTNALNKLDNCEYHGFKSQKEVLNYISKSKYLLSTSLGEGFPNVFIESWSLGTPVLSLNINPSDVITKFNLGRFFNQNFELLINNIGKLNMNNNSSHYINYVKNHHSPNKEIEKLIFKINSL